MGYFEACANPFRSDSAGRRVIAPFPLRGRVYLVPDDADATRIKAGVKWLRISLFAFIILSTPMNLGLIRMIAIVIVGSELWMYLLTRGLPIADVKRADLPRMPYRERAAREEAAFGKPTLWVIRTGGGGDERFFPVGRTTLRRYRDLARDCAIRAHECRNARRFLAGTLIPTLARSAAFGLTRFT